MTKLSVILPVYNVEKYLPRCLDSLLNQTLKDLEIICVNDGSTDNSLNVLNEYASKDNRLVIINQKNNGPGNARNSGLDIAKGEYIGFVDPDDWVEINAFEELYETAKKFDAKVLLFNFKAVSDINTVCHSQTDYFKEKLGYDLDETHYFTRFTLKEHFIDKIWSGIWDKIYSREFLQKFNIRFPESYSGEDWMFNLKVYYYSDKIYYLNKYLYYYYQRRTSLVYSYFDPKFSLITVAKEIQEFFDNHIPEFSQQIEEILTAALARTYKSIHFRRFKFRRDYRNKYKEVFKNDGLKRFLSYLKKNKEPFYRKIFSIRNKFYAVKQKEITIFGFKFLIEKRGQS